MTITEGAGRNVTLRFTDGETREVVVGQEETILAAAQAAGLNLVSQCEVGTCITCVSTLVDGSAAMPEGAITGLRREEIAAGQRLLCQTRALSDTVFDLEYPTALLEANPPIQFQAKISRVDWLTPNVVELQLRVPKSIRFSFTAGQYCRLKVPGAEEWRSYSMGSGEHERFKLTFLIRVLPTGAMSDFVRDRVTVGTKIDVEGPKGGFVLDPVPLPTVLMAGGTGLAPMLSMLDRLRTVQPCPPILLLFGCQAVDDLFHLDELEARQSFMPSLDVRVMLADNTGSPGIPNGNPVSALTAADMTPDTVAYLCGPPGMIQAATHKLLSLGAATHDIRSEQFRDSAN